MIRDLTKLASILILSVTLVSCTSLWQSEPEINIATCGATQGGQTLCTKIIQQAVDTCSSKGGGRVIIPAGTWLSGTIVMKDNVELHLAEGATLLGSTKHADYPTFNPEYRSHKDINGLHALIYAEKAENIAITGSGTIDGQGKKQKPREGKQFKSDRDGRPRNILFISCKNILIQGITMKNSGVWNQHYLNCEDLLVEDIEVYNHSNRNNDGIDIDGCRRFILRNSIIDSDDDAICLKSTGAAACEYITVSNCISSSHCNAIKTGTESTGGFKHVNITDITVKPCADSKVVYGQASGITAITVGCVDGGICEDINISDIRIQGTSVPIFVRLGKRNRAHTPGAEVKKDSIMKDITISNVTASDCGDWGCAILGLPGNPIKNLTLENIQITFAGGGSEEDSKRQIKEGLKSYPQPTSWGKLPVYGFFFRNAHGINMKNIDIKVAKKDVRSPIWMENVNGATLSNVKGNGTAVKPDQIIKKNVK